MDINQIIDHTILDACATERDIIEHCEEAKKHNFYSVCINSCYVPLAKQLLKDSKIKICAVIGFPLGASSTETKTFEAKHAINQGADEIDMVMNLGFFKSKNYLEVLKDIREVKKAIDKTPLKVIIEIGRLSKNGVVKASEICMDAKVDFIKTSTGFTKDGATLTAVKIIRKTVKDNCKIKASGGIHDYETAKKYAEIGVERIGTSKGVEISEGQLSVA